MSAAGKRVLLSWSSGKDSAFALDVLRRDVDVEVVGLVTTITSAFSRVAMHAVRTDVLEAQADAVGVPLWPVSLPWPCSNEAYEQAMSAAYARAVAEGVEEIAFGDLFLEDIRTYRERSLSTTGLKPLFPLWGRDTHALAAEMVASGQRAVLVCVDPGALDSSFAGRDFDSALLAELPETVDPCGENGEFHTFAYDGPAFRHPVAHRVGEVVQRDGFVFADVLRAGAAAAAPARGAGANR